MRHHPLTALALLLLGASAGCHGSGATPRGGEESKQSSASVVELRRLAGTWEAVAKVYDGLDQPEEGYRLTVRGDAFEVVQRGKTFIKGTLRVDPSKQPATLDFYPTQGDVPGKPLLAVYDLKDDEFRYCYVNPGEPRPGELTSRRGSERTLVTLRRAKPKQ